MPCFRRFLSCLRTFENKYNCIYCIYNKAYYICTININKRKNGKNTNNNRKY